MRRPISRLVVGLGVAAVVLLTGGVARAGTFPLVICGSSPRDPGDGLSWSANSPLVASPSCPAAGLALSLYADAGKTLGNRATAAFKITAPAGITFYGIHVVGDSSQGIGTSRFGSSGWWGEFYWNGGPGPDANIGPF